MTLSPHTTSGADGRTQTGLRERGIGLVIVLWIVAVMALLVSTFNASLQSTLQVESAGLRQQKGRALVWAGLEIAALRLGETDKELKWPADGTPQEVAFVSGRLRISIYDEAGRIDLNLADEKLIEGLAGSVTGNRRDAGKLADQILDWRDADKKRRSAGAEAGEYERVRAPYDISNGNFLDVTELRRVLDVSPDLFRHMLPLVTIYSNDGKVNVMNAPIDVLSALPDMTPRLLEEIGKARSSGDEAAVTKLLQDSAKFVSTKPGPAYLVRVDAIDQDGTMLESAEASILIGMDATVPYRILAFRSPPIIAGAASRTN